MRCLSDDALELVRAGATAVTSRPLLARVIMRQFVEWQNADGQTTWQRPRVLTINAWLMSLWKQRRYAEPTTPILLTAQQETFLWHSLIERDESTATPLLEVGATARQARLAALACAEYEIPLGDPRWRQDHDPTQFAGWLKQLNQMCDQEGWITLAQWWHLVPEWLRTENRLGEKLLLAGFDLQMPALQRVVKAWTDSGGEVVWEKPLRSDTSRTKTRPTLRSCESQEAEWDQAARWARQMMETTDSTSVAVVVPDLDSNRSRVQRVFRDIFTPGHLAAAVSSRKQEEAIEAEPIHLNSKAPLRDHPVIASALLVLESVTEHIPMSSASALLRSPYLAGAAAERMVRAQADIFMRRSRDLEVPLAFLVRAAKKAPEARRLFQEIRAFLMRRPELADFAHWARFIADLLKLAGWPGDSELSLSEQAIVEEWKNALSTLASLCLVSTKVTWPKALGQLRRLLAARQSDGDGTAAPVQILDIREAASIQFDYVWIAGLSPEHWNLGFNLFPLIPRALQLEAKMPDASPARQRVREREVLDALIHAGSEVVASFSKDPLPRLTSLIEALDLDRNEDGLPSDGLWAGTLWSKSFLVPSEMERLADSEAPHAKNVKPVGGTRIIKNQSVCPFRAFAEIRLNAIGPEEGTFGFDAMERGQFLHQVLEFVWKQIRTFERLKEHSASELEALVSQGIAAATPINDEPSEFHRELTEVERLRLGSLVLDWLDMEKQRQQPFTVEEMEQGKTVEIEGVTIKLRIDRIDRIKGDKLLLIDYKSGLQRFEKLEGERPEEPQLLVYAAALGGAVEGLLFGQVRRGDLKLVGITKDQQASGRKLKDLGAAWGSQQHRWNETVKRLARDFRQGVATVDPTPKACTFCDIKPLCRIQEIRDCGDVADGEGEE